MARRYLFLSPDVRSASGGVAVIYACVEKLCRAGYDAAVLHDGPGYRYADTPFDVPIFHSSRLNRTQMKYSGWRTRLKFAVSSGKNTFRGQDHRLTALQAEDILVVPEYLLAEAVEAFPRQPKVVFSQNPFGYLRSSARARERGLDPDCGVIHNLAVSDVCEDAVRLVSKVACSRVSVCPDLSLFGYREHKKRQIAYMPRKRRHEAKVIETALRERAAIADFELACIDRLPQGKVAEILEESLIFISLMHEEGLGFPGIEAMSAGCFVIGYTGLAGREYFDQTTGEPVTEGDTAGIVRAVENTVREYAANPARIDRIRKHASQHVQARYNEETFHATLLQAWRRLEAADLTPAGNHPAEV